MDRQALSERLMATFLVEIEEQVQTMTRELLAVERDSTAAPTALPVVFRAAHSLKGAARAVNLAPIERACHLLEGLLSAARDGRRALDADFIERCFAGIRALDDVSRRLRAQQSLLPGPLEDVIPLLHDQTGGPLRSSARPARPAEPHHATATTAPPPSADDTPAQDRIAKVPAETLDSLFANTAELLIARRRAAAECNEAATLHDDVRALRASWRRIVQPLRRLLRSESRTLSKRAGSDIEQTELRLKALEHRVDQLTTRIRAAVHALDRAAAAVERDVRQTRLVPFSSACEGLALAARDPAEPAAAPIDVVVEGADVLLGRSVLDALRAPLGQLVRNAVAHGSQTAEERAAAGKPPRGRILVSAAVQGDSVQISVSDDGRGVDRHAIAEAAARSGLPEPRSIDEALSLIFRPGFSTSLRPSTLSGRGVGLDIVRHQTEALQGHADAALEPGGGLRITLRVPVTLTTFRALFIKEAGQTFAIPLSGIRSLSRARATDFASASGRDMLITTDGPVPAVSLAGLLNLDAPARPANDCIPLVRLHSGRTQRRSPSRSCSPKKRSWSNRLVHVFTGRGFCPAPRSCPPVRWRWC
jgi:two-component system chemotaxis sensor kinase CheA